MIAYARNGHTDKFGIPRQSREESPILTRIVFEPEYNVREALRGIEGFSHLWLLWGFSEVQKSDVRCTKDARKEDVPSTKEWSPTVRPPRLGGNKRMGVFATRSPFRPNPIGLSSVRNLTPTLSKGEGVYIGESGRMELIVSGADVLDGTPIYDIKPYLSFSDSHPEAVNGFADGEKDHLLEVDWSAVAAERSEKGCSRDAQRTGNNALITRLSRANNALFTAKEQEEISYILSQDPRPGYQEDPARVYKMDYSGWRVHFRVEGKKAIVVGIEN